MKKHLKNKKLSIPFFAGLIVLTVLVLLLTKGPSSSPLSPTIIKNVPGTTETASPIASESANPRTQDLRLFFIALEDNGKKGEMVGCGDSIAPVEIQVPESQTPLKTVVQQLLSMKQQTVGPSKLYNSLSKSKLELKDVNINNGVATVHLTGEVSMGGECDSPRFQAQLEKTIKQFSNVNEAQIFINDKPLSEVLSLR